jgi:prepilin-type N-terminal cleavage/methylation domain-containing protein
MTRFKRLTAKRTKTKRRSQGFTLLEVMISGTIFLIGFAGTLLGVTAAMDLYGQHRRSTIAIQLAEATMEELLFTLQGTPALRAGTHAGSDFTKEGKPTNTDVFFESSWTVTPETPISGMKAIEVKVTWPGASRPVFLRTYRP